MDVLNFALAAARSAFVHDHDTVFVRGDNADCRAVVGRPAFAFADVEQQRIHALLGGRSGVQVVGEDFLMGRGAGMHDNLAAFEMGVAEGRSDEHRATGELEVRRHLAVGDHALQIGQGGGEEAGILRMIARQP